MSRVGLAFLLACCVAFAWAVNTAATKLADQFDAPLSGERPHDLGGEVAEHGRAR